MNRIDSLLIGDLLHGYRAHRFTPTQVIDSALERADQAAQRHVWIHRLARDRLLEYAAVLERRPMQELPLYGVPFVIKDNIDLVGAPTTAGCAEFSYQPASSAFVVQRLIDAGAIPLGKTNLDQFATGLVGTRSPYGACRNSFDADYISGGSSAGSAVAVATGLASFALGTDTAGSGRVPAAFNNIVGLKPSCGRISTRGVVPACRSLDCVSIFALTGEDAARVLAVAEGYDDEEPYSRRLGDVPVNGRRFGIPRRDQLQFFGDRDYEHLFEQAVARIESIGGTVSRIDFSPFLESARLLYGGPWVAERYAAIEEFISKHAAALHPVTRRVIEGGTSASAVELFKAQDRLKTLKRAADRVWEAVDVILTPTAGTIYTRAAVEAAPIELNSTLGYYTNFMNLLDMAGVAVPAGFRPDGLPFGVTLVGPCASDRSLLALGGELHRALVDRLGAPDPAAERIEIAVCGAHMDGLALNHELRSRGGHCVRRTRTTALYRLYALPGGPPRRPGLVRVGTDGTAIEVEVWSLPAAEFGAFSEGVAAPLSFGRVWLEGGGSVLGFTCDPGAAEGATDITAFGGWRAYLQQGP
jgi:allophanate hydrolase